MSPRYSDAARHCGKSWLHSRHRCKAIKNCSLAVDENSSDGFTSVRNDAGSRFQHLNLRDAGKCQMQPRVRWGMESRLFASNLGSPHAGGSLVDFKGASGDLLPVNIHLDGIGPDWPTTTAVAKA
jgi:hypothetical protein